MWYYIMFQKWLPYVYSLILYVSQVIFSMLNQIWTVLEVCRMWNPRMFHRWVLYASHLYSVCFSFWIMYDYTWPIQNVSSPMSILYVVICRKTVCFTCLHSVSFSACEFGHVSRGRDYMYSHVNYVCFTINSVCHNTADLYMFTIHVNSSRGGGHVISKDYTFTRRLYSVPHFELVYSFSLFIEYEFTWRIMYD